LGVFRFELPCLQSLNLGAKIFFRFAELLLQTSQQFILFPLGKREIVIGQLTGISVSIFPSVRSSHP
jgi:hypothetical protein